MQLHLEFYNKSAAALLHIIPYLHKSYKYISRDPLMFGINMMNSSHTVCCAWVNGWVSLCCFNYIIIHASINVFVDLDIEIETLLSQVFLENI